LYSIILKRPRQAHSLGLSVILPMNLIDWLAVTRTLVSVYLLAAAATLLAQQPAAPPERAAPRGAIDGRLTWFDRKGNRLGTIGEPGLYRTLTISPDGKHVAVERTDAQTQNKDIWVLDVSSGTASRFTSDPGWDAFPTWSPDGRRIVFTSNRGGGVYNLYQKASSGEGNEELLYQSKEGKGPNSWSPDGRLLIYYSLGQPTHLRLLAVDGPADRQPIPLVDPQFSSVTGRFSPDGRWIAYSSNESGKSEISVRPFDAATGTAGAPIVVTQGGGTTPLWSGDGKELFYIAPGGTATAIEVSAGATFQSGALKPLFKVPPGLLFWDASPNTSGDGTRFLMPVPGN
jgi:Tol biopolymer transport system component